MKVTYGRAHAHLLQSVRLAFLSLFPKWEYIFCLSIFALLVRPELRRGGEGLIVFSSITAANQRQSLTSLRETNTKIPGPAC